jgi:hypothetical protein
MIGETTAVFRQLRLIAPWHARHDLVYEMQKKWVPAAASFVL